METVLICKGPKDYYQKQKDLLKAGFRWVNTKEKEYSYTWSHIVLYSSKDRTILDRTHDEAARNGRPVITELPKLTTRWL